MIRLVKNKKRKNPVLRSINGIKYEIIDNPKYDEYQLIKKFSEIIDQKFPKIKNKIPLILFEKIRSDYDGQFSEDDNEISINSFIDNINNHQLRVLFHELGHFIYRLYLSDSAKREFINYIRRNTKVVNIDELITLVRKYSEEKIKENYSIYWAIIMNLYHNREYAYYIENINQKDYKAPFSEDFLEWFYNRKDKKFKSFIKPSSHYSPNTEEIFCEIFANYMMYDLRLLHSDNYRILRYILPELKS